MTDFNPQSFLKNLTQQPGVYRMLDAKSQVLYVGKAKNLKQRITSYFRGKPTSRMQRMTANIAAIEITVTATETEALLLENTLIKTLHPRYNILLRDDKTYPYIYLTTQHSFPRLTLHRGNKNSPGRYFGPYSSAKAARETLNLLPQIFPIRQCEDTQYRARTRPCLEYQLKRCSAPCVGLITKEDYANEVTNTILFLNGRTNQIINSLSQRMETYSAKLEFEEAAKLRDQIAALRRIQERQHVSGANGDLDIIAVAIENAIACAQVFRIRDGNMLNNQVFFPKLPETESLENLMTAFLGQYYLEQIVPNEILVSCMPNDALVLKDALSAHSGHTVVIKNNLRGTRARWMEMAITNAKLALATQLASSHSYVAKFQSLQESLLMPTVPKRLECFDVSHTSGEKPVAACVVFDHNGPKTADYRRFNIENITAGDDYAALTQALRRHYLRVVNGEVPLPDILCIDGGKGQLAQAAAVLSELGIIGLPILAIAKGPERKPGAEELWLSGQEQPFKLASHAPALHLIQHIRDEAHRFAIVGHRARRARARNASALETIPGIGPKRRQLILKQFGGMQSLQRAGIEDIAKITGIGPNLAQVIHTALHNHSH